MLYRRKEQACNERDNTVSSCSPSPSDIWNNGTIHSFVWNPGYPFYSSYETLDLYLYYKENLQLHLIKNWTALPCSAGSWAVQVDDSWFPLPLPYNQTQKGWVMYGYILPSLMNPTEELSDPESQYPRPFNFTIMQFGQLHYGNDSSVPIKTDSPTDPLHEFPIWAMIVLAITSATLFLVLIMCLLCFLYRRCPMATNITDQREDSKKEQAEDEDEQEEERQRMDASWQRRSSILSSANAAQLSTTLQKMLESPDDPEERRRRQGDQLLRRELEADKETMVKDTSKMSL